MYYLSESNYGLNKFIRKCHRIAGHMYIHTCIMELIEKFREIENSFFSFFDNRILISHMLLLNTMY